MGYVIEAALLTGLALVYPALCWLRPFRPCHWCRGLGCRWCAGTGMRMRWGRRLFDAAQRARAEAGR